jgi:type VI protein secretion system component Hcp
VTFAGLPGQGLDAPSDVSSVKIAMQAVRQTGGGFVPQPGPITLVKPLDSNSPRLLLAAATLTSLTSARIELLQPSTKATALVYVLQDAVFVSGFRLAPSGTGVFCEELDFDYCRIEVTAIPGQGPPSTVTFDRCNATGN